MNFFGKKSVSSVLYRLSLGVTLIMTVISLLVIYYLITGNYNTSSSGTLILNIPGTDLNLKTHHSIFIILGSFMFNTVYFYVLSRLFKTFSNAILFSEQTIRHLRVFAYFNVIAPIVACFIAFLILDSANFEFVIQGALVIAVGIFCFMILSIIKKGQHLQTENDLTI